MFESSNSKFFLVTCYIASGCVFSRQTKVKRALFSQKLHNRPLKSTEVREEMFESSNSKLSWLHVGLCFFSQTIIFTTGTQSYELSFFFLVKPKVPGIDRLAFYRKLKKTLATGRLPHIIKFCLWILRKKTNSFRFTSIWEKIHLKFTSISVWRTLRLFHSFEMSMLKFLRNSSILWNIFSHKWESKIYVWLSTEKHTMGGRSGRGRFPALQMLLQLRSVVETVFPCAWSFHTDISSPQIYCPHKYRSATFNSGNIYLSSHI